MRVIGLRDWNKFQAPRRKPFLFSILYIERLISELFSKQPLSQWQATIFSSPDPLEHQFQGPRAV